MRGMEKEEGTHTHAHAVLRIEWDFVYIRKARLTKKTSRQMRKQLKSASPSFPSSSSSSDFYPSSLTSHDSKYSFYSTLLYCEYNLCIVQFWFYVLVYTVLVYFSTYNITVQ